ncbi:NAD(P)H-dependent oxidoreductase subunit E [Thermosipho atlanticus]|uniref:Thioredoxin-like [2Fe-2S] ferredoxin n=1 Tax=Thermosipho atlanticus DSM 15807 TaxID=1123380 RepID=A0A1M5RCH4_9BACT|nr:NAD(P)H-dependent oxidoreductase subunit E [Thermosipho atlanticus]SHH23830.1 Thioredoxin-like [2Fe-2S] ferredoxin [Thermosipho atlanticus DSM 15807]
MEKIKVEICVGTMCHIMGSHALVEVIENLPDKIKNKLDYKFSPCFNVCNEAKTPPVVKINGNYYENVTPKMLDQLIRDII